MKRVYLAMLATAVFLLVAFSVSRTVHRDHASSLSRKMIGDGGNGTNGGAMDGQNGMPGCDGGIIPSADGKFYVSGTKQECNPSEEDRKKAR